MIAALPLLLLLTTAGETDVSVRGTSRTFVVLGGRPYYSTSEARLIERRTVPIIQELFVEAKPGVEGVTVAVDAWVGVDSADRVLAERVLADVDQGWVRWRRPDFTLVVGRAPIFSLTGRGLRIDGAHFELHPRTTFAGGLKLWLEGWGGLPVNPNFGQEPLERARPVFVNDPLEIARGNADWDRPGDWAVGVGGGAAYREWFAASIGYLRVQDLAEVGRESLVARLDLTPVDAVGVRSFGAVDLYGRGVEEAEVDLFAWPMRDLRVGLYGRYADPSLLLPSTSILSVFGGPNHTDVGVELDLFLGRIARLSAYAELRQATADVEDDDDAFGSRAGATVRGRLPLLNSGRGVVGYEFLDDRWYGRYHRARVGAEVPLADYLSVTVDGAAFVFERIETAGVLGPRREAFRVGAAGNLHFEGWRLVLATRVTEVADLATDFSVLGRLEWNVEQSF